MERRISRYFILLLINVCLLCGFASPAAAQVGVERPRPMSLREKQRLQEEEKKQKKMEVEALPLYNGMHVGLDLFGAAQYLFGSGAVSSELQVTVNLRNMFLPTVEVGYGVQDDWSDSGIHAKSKAPYFRVGMDYNLFRKKKEKNSFMFLGVRYGFSPVIFSVENAPVHDPIYGGVIDTPALDDEYWGESLPFAKDMKASLHWMEAVLGVKVQIYRNFSMGWSARVRFKLGGKEDLNGHPDYVPGYGKYKNANFGLTYSFIYQIPVKQK